MGLEGANHIRKSSDSARRFLGGDLGPNFQRDRVHNSSNCDFDLLSLALPPSGTLPSAVPTEHNARRVP
jgi:hypothetical protein